MGRIVSWTALLLAAAGCQDAGPTRVPVVGRILLDGKPLTYVAITFSPVGETKGNGAIGGSDAAGQFGLNDIRGPNGVIPGEYLVYLYPAPPAGIKEGDPREVVAPAGGGGIPPVYLDRNHTPLRVTVPDQGCTVEIDIPKSKKPPTVTITPGPPKG